jgi:hypothetical protein
VHGWIWRRLPGGTGARCVQVAMLVIVAGLLLWFLIYPWLSIRVPFGQSGLG